MDLLVAAFGTETEYAEPVSAGDNNKYHISELPSGEVVYIFRPRLVKDFPLNVGVPVVR
jgi:hypothetical protein